LPVHALGDRFVTHDRKSAKTRSLASVEQEAMDKRVDLEIARLEVEALARSYGLTRSTRLVNVTPSWYFSALATCAS
jgi:outer membrane protein TolC